jgi:hypothetical protein
MLVPIRVFWTKCVVDQVVYPRVDVRFGLSLDFRLLPAQSNGDRLCHTASVTQHLFGATPIQFSAKPFSDTRLRRVKLKSPAVEGNIVASKSSASSPESLFQSCPENFPAPNSPHSSKRTKLLPVSTMEEPVRLASDNPSLPERRPTFSTAKMLVDQARPNRKPVAFFPIAETNRMHLHT